MSILIIDDSKPIRRALKAILEEAGYHDVLTASSAIEGLEMLQAQIDLKKRAATDLILMDIIMPEMDGLEAVRTIKSDSALTNIPIIIVSAFDDDSKIEHAFDAGAIDFISKPVRKMELKARVRSVLKLKEEMDKRIAREQEMVQLNKKLEKANQKLQAISNTDGLTGIANRRQFDQLFEKEWRRCLRNQQAISLIMGDIDFFKAYNDNYGHLEGDHCLRKVAQALSRCIKRPADLVARYGGEEFVTLLPDTDTGGAAEVADSMRRKVLALCIEHADSPIAEHVSISLGTATVTPSPGLASSVLIDYADRALYLAKSEGRNQVRSISF